MMLGERTHRYLTLDAPPWPAAASEWPTTGMRHHLPLTTTAAALAALRCFVPSTDPPADDDDVFSGDRFRMYEFKIRRCPRGRSHDWTECPYAHPGEKARRRDPRRFRYASAPCPEFRKGGCKKGDACENAHGVFESWLHPERYRTQPCKDGTACRRRVCFFAHTPDQLRLAASPRSPKAGATATATLFASPPISPTYGSPPLSPAMRRMPTLLRTHMDGIGVEGGAEEVPDVGWVTDLVK